MSMLRAGQRRRDSSDIEEQKSRLGAVRFDRLGRKLDESISSISFLLIRPSPCEEAESGWGGYWPADSKGADKCRQW